MSESIMWAFLRHFLTPHHTNNHRPKALHPQSLLFYAASLLVLQFTLTTLRYASPDILGFATDIQVEKLLLLTNEKRLEQGIHTLNLDPQLSQAAADKAHDMFSKDYWAHNSPDGLTPWIFVRKEGYTYLYAGENLAKNFGNSEGVVNAWMASPSHKANIMKPEYQDVGFAVVNGRLGDEETTLVVQMFGTKQKTELATYPVKAQNLVPANLIPKSALTPTPTLQVFPITKEATTAGFAGAHLPKGAFNSVKNTPVFDIFSLTKNTSLFLMAFLMLVLVLDTILIWRRRTVRVSGHNLAHLFLLLMVVGAIWFTNPGVIR